MSIPKQDETPGHVWADITDDEIEPGRTVHTIMYEGGSLCDMTCPADDAEKFAAHIVQACNAYGSTDALRSALETAKDALTKIRAASLKGCPHGYGKPELFAEELYASHWTFPRHWRKSMPLSPLVLHLRPTSKNLSSPPTSGAFSGVSRTRAIPKRLHMSARPLAIMLTTL